MQALRCALIANRGEIAVRCIKACQALSIKTVALYTQADAGSLHIHLADTAAPLLAQGPEAYTDIDALLWICEQHGVDAVIPGYGFLSENAAFARRVESLGMVFVGPSADAIESMGLKHTARALALAAGVPAVPGSELVQDAQGAVAAARTIGFPVMIKASGGGGGIGMQICLTEEEVPSAFESVRGRSAELFQDSGVFLERYIARSHHIEVQVFGNGSEVIHFGERECSIQRRQQKVIEECPSPFLAHKPERRQQLAACAVSLAKSIGYRSAGTVEFLVDDETGDFFFLEMNTRLQVEHGITELCYDVDLVQLMLEQADYQLRKEPGIPTEKLKGLQRSGPRGAAIEARICCEDPAAFFMPSSGHIQEASWATGQGIRVDTWIQPGSSVSPYFDSLLAKLMVHSTSRAQSVKLLASALEESRVAGVSTSLAFLSSIVKAPEFIRGVTLTTFLEKEFIFCPSGLRVRDGGQQTTIQQLRPRNQKGYGIAKSGPLDDLCAAVSNLLVGNSIDTECLEVTHQGPTLYFHSAAIVSACGAPFDLRIDGTPSSMWTRIFLRPGQTLSVGSVAGKGSRCYIAFKGGFPRLPEWLGSKSTTPSLGLGGLQGRALRTGDFLDLQDISSVGISYKELQLPENLMPSAEIQEIHVMHGPHDSDDFVTQSGRDTLYSAEWQVDHNCSRTGIRLVGPHLEWSRADGGRGGGAHPSNVVDYPYPSPGGINWTGDSPVIFPNDAPGFGGFLCTSTVVSADLWKLGQLRPGGSIRLSPISYSTARALQQRKDDYLAAVEAVLSGRDEPQLTSLPWQPLPVPSEDTTPAGALLGVLHGSGAQLSLTLRQSGDCFIIGELGFQHGSFETSISANLLAKAIRDSGIDVFCHVNISSIMVEFDPKRHTQSTILSLIREAYARSTRDLSSPQPVPCRRLILPIVFDHPALQEAEDRYMKLQRSKAAYLPDNVHYVQQNNGLGSRQAVLDILRRSRFVIVAVGFMTGLPLLLPLNPIDRLTAQKHNPTRIYTPAGAVGVGGGLFCIYPAEQPGGYMIVARTIPVWDQFSLRNGFGAGKPWLCEPFDLVEFREVSIEEYGQIEDEFKAGTYRVDIRESELDVGLEVSREREAYKTDEVRRFLERQGKAVEEMQKLEEKLLAEWQAEQATSHPSGGDKEDDDDDDSGNPGERVVSPHDGKVWKILVAAGDRVSVGQELLVLEAMKMEIKVTATAAHDGMVVDRLVCDEGVLVQAGRTLMRLSRMS